MTSKELGDCVHRATNKEWVQALGSSYSLFEVAYNAFTSRQRPAQPPQVAAKLRTHELHRHGAARSTSTAGPVPGVAIIEPVGVQWKKSTGPFPYEMQIVDNSGNKASR